MKYRVLIIILIVLLFCSCGNNNYYVDQKGEPDHGGEKSEENERTENNNSVNLSLVEGFKKSYIHPADFGLCSTALDALETQSKKVSVKEEEGDRYNISCECELADGEIKNNTSGMVTIKFMYDPGTNVSMPVEMYDGKKLLESRYMQEFIDCFEGYDLESEISERGYTTFSDEVDLHCNWWKGELERRSIIVILLEQLNIKKVVFRIMLRIHM